MLLSVKAGMRAGEIANLTWDMVLDADAVVGSMIELRDAAAKKGSGRLIPSIRTYARPSILPREMTTGQTAVMIRSERGRPDDPREHR